MYEKNKLGDKSQINIHNSCAWVVWLFSYFATTPPNRWQTKHKMCYTVPMLFKIIASMVLLSMAHCFPMFFFHIQCGLWFYTWRHALQSSVHLYPLPFICIICITTKWSSAKKCNKFHINIYQYSFNKELFIVRGDVVLDEIDAFSMNPLSAIA